jgi:DNA-directed RNA polymerase subunit N (RpoN/RPB10)
MEISDMTEQQLDERIRLSRKRQAAAEEDKKAAEAERRAAHYQASAQVDAESIREEAQRHSPKKTKEEKDEPVFDELGTYFFRRMMIKHVCTSETFSLCSIVMFVLAGIVGSAGWDGPSRVLLGLGFLSNVGGFIWAVRKDAAITAKIRADAPFNLRKRVALKLWMEDDYRPKTSQDNR